MKATITTAVVALSTIAAGAHADGFSHMSGSLSYGNINSNDPFLIGQGFTALGSFDYEMGNFRAFVDAGTSSRQAAGPGVNVYALSADVGYQITPNMLVYVGAAHFAVNFGGTGPGQTVYKLGAQGDFGALTVAAQAVQGGQPGSNPLFELMGEYKVNSSLALGVRHTFSQQSGTTASFTSAYAEYSAGALDLTAAGHFTTSGNQTLYVDASYEFGGKYRASAGVVGGRSNSGLTYTSYSAGIGYQLMNNLWLDAQVGRATSTAFGIPSITTAALTMSYEMGKETRLVDRNRTRDLRFIQFQSPTNGIYAPVVQAGFPGVGIAF